MLVSTIAATAVAFGMPLLAVPAPDVGPLPDRCVRESPCVFIDPPVDPWQPAIGAVVTYHGRGWRPHERIEASWGTYCSPTAEACFGMGLSTAFRADGRGRFVFRLRHGRRPPPGPGPKGAGSEAASFISLSRRSGEGLRRDGTFAPPQSTAQQRREARAVAAAVTAYDLQLIRLRPKTVRATDRHNDEVGRCQDLLRARSPIRERAVERMTDAAIAAASWDISPAPRRAFVRRLEALRVRDGQLAMGVAAWIRAARRPQWAPRPGLCAALRRWRAAGAPLDDPALTPTQPLLQEEITGSIAVGVAARRLEELRADPDAADAFSGGVFDLTRYVNP